MRALHLVCVAIGRTIATFWRPVLAGLPLPMLALAASYGVYSFARLFVPEFFARVQAGAFELTYIGLAVLIVLDERQRRRARAISVGAVLTSIIYNTLAGWFHQRPELLATASNEAWLALAVLHGMPLAWVAYLVSDLLLHRDQAGAPVETTDQPTLAWAGPVLVATPASYARVEPQPVYPAPVAVHAENATEASTKATKLLVCPACSATLTTGEYGAAKRWGRCKHCKGAQNA